jgi:hypothetical protein
MKIPEKDYNLLVGLVEFHFKFAEYIREQDSEMFHRAIDYARTFTNSNGVQFEYWHEDNKKFLHELYNMLLKKRNSYEKFIDSRLEIGDDLAEAIDKWTRKKKTNREDPLGIKNYMDNFIRHSKELDYNLFDEEDWDNFFGICKFTKNEGFATFVKKILEKTFGNDSDKLKRFENE